MKKSIIFFVILLVSFNSLIFSQSCNSLQLNGGLISTTNSNEGLLGTLQYNFQTGKNLEIYSYSGIMTWNKNKISYFSVGEHSIPKETYTEDNHRMIPLYLGARYYFNNASSFRPFFVIEAGLAFLSFNSYQLQTINNPDGSRTMVPADKSSQNETLFGAGLGLGATHNLGESLQLSVELKINALKNSRFNWFSSGGTMRSFQVGLGYKF